MNTTPAPKLVPWEQLTPLAQLAVHKEHNRLLLTLRAWLGSALVSRLVSSPPAWEYELGSLAASSLVTALGDRPRVDPGVVPV
jgi:hypothetical protein